MVMSIEEFQVFMERIGSMVRPAMSPEEVDHWYARLAKPVIAAQFRKIEHLMHEAGQKAIEGGADPDEVAAILEDARFNKDGWWDS